MADLSATAQRLRFGVFELNVRSGELRRHGQKIRLPDQAFQILQLLLDRPGDVVTREEVRQRLWKADTFIDFDVGVNTAIRKLREALDDSAENPRFIETLPRRGYRFIGPEPVSDPATGGTTARIRPAWVAVGLVAATAVVTLALVNARGWPDRPHADSAAKPIRSLAVLPFENLTGDRAQDYFVDGMTDALTNHLAQVAGLDVISRTSANQYKQDARKPLPAIGKELNVDALVEGAVVRSGQHVRITAQLIHAATDRHIWAQSYDSELSDVLVLQREMARGIAAAIQGRLAPATGPAGAERTRAVSPEAYDAYLKGLAVAGRQTYDGYRNAVAYFESATASQPDFAPAYVALSQAQLQFLFTGPLSPRETIPKAEAAVRKALELDDTLAEAHLWLGAILHDFYWRWEDGDKEIARGRALSANFSENQSVATMALIRNGRLAEAIAESARAHTRDPLSFAAYVNLAIAYRAAGEYDRAIVEIRRALEIVPGQNRAHFQLGVTYTFMGRLNDAIGELESVVRSNPANLRFRAYLGYAYAAAGRRPDARRIVNELEAHARQQYVSSFGIALIYDALGEKDSALAAVERACQDRAIEFAWMNQYPPFKTIASDPRFRLVMRQVGLSRRS